jgi:two-component system CheB/CheR fusion protein
VSVDGEDAFEAVLEYVKRSRGFDFTGYKRSSLVRRVERRLGEVGAADHAEYLDFLQVHPDEFAFLFNTLLINVTGFFRDPVAWDYLEREVIPRILEHKSPHEPIRIWSAGCASGEEAYSAAILLAEALDPAAYRDRVKIYATDVDEEALAQARQGTYGAKEVAALSLPRREQYFEPLGSSYVFRNDLRRAVIFGRHDLVQDAPISRLDLLLCRNVLMYFNTETQARVLNHLHFALSDDGYLFLGKAEMLLTRTHMFSPVDLKYRVFARVSAPGERALANNGPSGQPTLTVDADQAESLGQLSFDNAPVAQIVVNRDGMLTSANRSAQALFRLTGADLGSRFHDLELSYRPIELRSRIAEVHNGRTSVSVDNAEFLAEDGSTRYLDIVMTPLVDGEGTVLGVTITFEDVTRSKHLHDDLQKATEELETAYEELQSTNEELETTNEELQSTVEELETTNEELQSTNEELETMNEELQSTNTELETINDELQERTVDLDLANASLEAILTSLTGAVAVVDRDLRVGTWNAQAEDLWGLRVEEVRGESLLDLDFGLPVAELGSVLGACLAGDAPPSRVTLAATNRRGKGIVCRVTCSPFIGPGGERAGVVLLMEPLPVESIGESDGGSAPHQ